MGRAFDAIIIDLDSVIDPTSSQAYSDAVENLRQWKKDHSILALVSSSKSAQSALSLAGISDLFDVILDGGDLDKTGIHGKPAPEIYLEAAKVLQIEPKRAIVLENTIPGIEAARHGGFGKVIGIARESSGDNLLIAGADLVVRDFYGISLTESSDELKSEWSLTYKSWDPSEEPTRETLCTLANGYFGTRGAPEESAAGDVHYPGTYLAGAYNRLSSMIQGHPVENEDLVNWPNWLCLCFRPMTGDWFAPEKMTLLDWEQELDLQSGVLIRKLRVRDDAGRETSLMSRRIVSMAEPHLAAIEWILTPENWDEEIIVRTGLDGNICNAGVKRYSSFSNRHLDILEKGDFIFGQNERGISLTAQTNHSHIRMALAARLRIRREGEEVNPEIRTVEHGDFIAQDHTFQAIRGIPIKIEKTIALFHSGDHAISDPTEASKLAVSRTTTFSDILGRHGIKWSHLWQRAGVDLTRNSREQLILRLHLFHIFQTHSINSIEKDAGIPARGIHGEGYRGHVFWDELFIFPIFNFRIPELSRELLQYRYYRLNEARQLARQAGFRGAMYPWQSASSGREETPSFHLNPLSKRWIQERSCLQIHVNAAIAYNIWHYYQVTVDQDFIAFRGAEMLLEIARFWATRSTYNPKRARFEIKNVVGPDEFHVQYPGSTQAGIHNNAYTNFMASWTLRKALTILDSLDQERRSELELELQITPEELHHWDEVSRKLHIPIRNDGIIEQFEGYFQLKDLDFSCYQKKYGDLQRLDRILECEGRTTQDYKTIKQADVLMLFYLFSTEELKEQFSYLGYPFEPSCIPSNIDYYLKQTVHGSTLSRAVHSWVLSRVDRRSSWGLFKEALESDICDIQGGTTREGIHLGAMGETVDIIQRCYSGMEPRDDVLWFNPKLPDELPSVRMRIRYRGHWLTVFINHQKMRILVDRSLYTAAQIGFNGEVHTIRQGEYRVFELKSESQRGASGEAA